MQIYDFFKKIFRCRQLLKGPACGGKCVGSSTQTVSCNSKCCCKKDCKWSPWTDWSECEAVNKYTQCGPGKSVRSRKVAQYASCGGKHCKGPCEQHKSCKVS